MLNKTIKIAVGIIRSEDHRIFITQRGEHSHLAGLWEFPGGKIKSNETPREALYRELFEEVDIHVRDAVFLETVEYDYGDRNMTIYAYLVENWDGEPFGKEGQSSRWVSLFELDADQFPSANRPIIEMLKNDDKTL